jgi:hypothetical protein
VVDVETQCIPIGCNVGELLRLTRWYVEHVQPEPEPSNVINAVCLPCNCIYGEAAILRCLADQAEAEEAAAILAREKREGLIRVLDQCEKGQGE